jgi:hypothetical protein
MNTTLSVEECRELIKPSNEWSLNKKLLNSLNNTRDMVTNMLSVRECFDLARQLLPELKAYDGWFDHAPIVPAGQRGSITSLLRSFQQCDNITHAEFLSILNEADLFITDLIVRNPTLPIDILMEPSFLSRHLSNPKYSELVLTIRFIKTRRIEEVTDFCRRNIPGSESMTDEMVLKIAGA